MKNKEELEELLRQRRLIEEHLRWLDRQITEAQGEASPEPISSDPKPALDNSQIPLPESDPFPLPPVDRKSIQRSIAGGCAFYIAVGGLLLVVLWLVYVYLIASN